MTIITVWSESGGVGKTTTTINVASSLSNSLDVLVCDVDPQPAGLTNYLQLDRTVNNTNLTEVLLDNNQLSDIVINDHGEFDVIPSHSSLANLESTVRSEGIKMGEFLLQNKLSKIEDDYDVILIDAPATLSLLVDNALIASDSVLIPMEMTEKGVKSISGVVDTVNSLVSQIRNVRPEFEIEITGVVPNKTEDTVINKEVLDQIDESMDIDIITDGVPNYNVLNKAWQDGLTIQEYEDKIGLNSYEKSIIDSYDTIAEYINNNCLESEMVIENVQ